MHPYWIFVFFTFFSKKNLTDSMHKEGCPDNECIMYNRGHQAQSWKAGVLQSLAPTCLNTPYWKFQVYLRQGFPKLVPGASPTLHILHVPFSNHTWFNSSTLRPEIGVSDKREMQNVAFRVRLQEHVWGRCVWLWLELNRTLSLQKRVWWTLMWCTSTGGHFTIS